MEQINIDRLVDLVILALKQRETTSLPACDRLKSCLSLGDNPFKANFNSIFHFVDEPALCDFATVHNIPITSLLNLASGVSTDRLERQIIECFSQNKPVYLIDFGFDADQCNKEFSKLVLSAKTRLKSFGVHFVTSDEFTELFSSNSCCSMVEIRKTLYTEKDILSLPKGSRLNIKNAILTPSAKDVAREFKLDLFKE